MLTHTLFALILSLASFAHAEPPPPPTPASPASPAPEALIVEVVVQGGYQPARIEVPAGRPVTLRFLRTEYGGCTRELVFPTLELRRELPTNVPVDVELGALSPGEVPFHCGMHMIHGALIVTAGE